MLRRIPAVAGGSVGAGWLWLSSDVDSAPARAVRSLGYGLLIGCDYKFGPATRIPRGTAEHAAALSATHQRSADRMLAVCQAHGGLYNKFGQYISSMTVALPPEYPRVLAACQDRAPAVSLSKVRQTIESELGAPLGSLFSVFEEQPVAAASLAQVHRAVTAAGGEQVAVKVQYPLVARQVSSDLWALHWLSRLVGWAFPGYGYGWIIDEFKGVALEELDFRAEARNAARCAAFFSDWPAVHVPATLPRLSSERVLTMEWIDGAKLDDPGALAAAGVRPADVAPLLTAAFSAMIFESGFVHCDPHPGNLLARRTPGRDGGWRGGGAQLVLLDHGMYRSLSDEYRRSYSRLWVSLLTRDHDEARDAARQLGVRPQDFEALAVALTFRPPSSRAPIGQSMSQADRRALRDRYSSVDATDVNRFLSQLPREMMMVMRTWGLVRSLNRALGGTTRQRFLTMATYAARGAVIRHAGRDGTGADSGRAPVARLLIDLLLVGRLAWRGCAAWCAVVRVRALLAVELLYAQVWAAGRLAQGTEGLLAPGVQQYG